MDAVTAERVQVGRQRRHEGLTFTSTHFRNIAVVQHHAADQLYVEGPHMHGSDRGLAGNGKSLWQQLVERFAVRITLFEFCRLGS